MNIFATVGNKILPPPAAAAGKTIRRWGLPV
jgi:hypothetical protein